MLKCSMGQNRIAFIYLAIVLVLIGLLGQSQLIGLSLVQNKILESYHFGVSNRFFGEDSGVGDIGNFRERMDIIELDYHMSVSYAMDLNFTSHFQIFYQNFTYVIINVFNRLMDPKTRLLII